MSAVSVAWQSPPSSAGHSLTDEVHGRRDQSARCGRADLAEYRTFPQNSNAFDLNHETDKAVETKNSVAAQRSSSVTVITCCDSASGLSEQSGGSHEEIVCDYRNAARLPSV